MKKIIIIVILVLFLSINVSNVYANTEKYGCTMRSARCGDENEVINTMNIAKETYELYDYSTNNLTDPSEMTFLSNVMGKQIQLYWCHGRARDLIALENFGLKTGNSSNENVGSSENPWYIYAYSINQFDWDDKLLITLASCNIAMVEDPDYSLACNIAESGANMVVGWYTELNQESGPDWLDNYHRWLADGYTVQEAIEYANSRFYVYTNVRNNILYHNGSIKNLAGEEWIQLSSRNNISMDSNIVPLNQEIMKNDIESVLTQYDSTFNLQNFEKQEETCSYVKNVDTNEYTKVSKYIDYVEKIGDFYTNSAYIVELDELNKVRKIYDNTVDASTIMMLRNDTTTVSDNTKEYYIQKARANIEDTDLIIDEEVKLQWDLNENKKYIYIELIMKEMDINSTYSYKYELN